MFPWKHHNNAIAHSKAMADTGYYTFCPHCERDLPARTFRYHRDQYYNSDNNRWERSLYNSDSSDDGMLPMDHDHDDSTDEDIFTINHSDHNSDDTVGLLNNSNGLLHSEIWDDLLPSKGR